MADVGRFPAQNSQLQNMGASIPGVAEVISWELYHYQDYATAGQTQLTFFQTTAGALATGLEGTNMEVAGMLPSPQAFLLQTIEVHFFPATAPSVATGAAAVIKTVNDTYNVLKSGFAELEIVGKKYARVANLLRLPPKVRLEGSFALADTTTAGAAQQTRVGLINPVGGLYRIDPNLLIHQNENFKVTLNWTTAVALLDAGAAKIGVVLGGVLFRA